MAFFIGGGSDGVGAAAQDAEKNGYLNVFGLVDRDHRRTNYPDWLQPGKNFLTFILPVHEIENYLLASKALATSRWNHRRKTEAEIERHLEQKAQKLLWWAACRAVIAELRRRFRGQFVVNPPCDESKFNSQSAALRHICDSEWFRSLPDAVSSTTEPDVQQLLTEAYTDAEAQLEDGRWREEFSGKEIFRDIGSRICDHGALPENQRRPVEFDVGLAQEVARWQKDHGPPEPLTKLLQALRARVNRAQRS